MKEFINDNFYPFTILAIVLTICMFALIHCHQIEEYCKTKESNGDWRCVTWEDLESRNSND